MIIMASLLAAIQPILSGAAQTRAFNRIRRYGPLLVAVAG